MRAQRPGVLTESVDSSPTRGADDAYPVPGLLLAFSMGNPQCAVIPLQNGQLEIGRGEGASPFPADPRMSRRHAKIAFDGQSLQVEDCGSHNGTFLDGTRLTGSVRSTTARVLRTGDSLFLFSSDLRPLREHGVIVKDGMVLGPTLKAVLAQAARASEHGRTLHIIGESGSGKEGIARAFHAQSRLATGPFVSINCATIAAGVAERLLFGAKRGAFSGAVADSEGLLQAADGGTLFLDEIAELDLAVQAKMLRVIETYEVLPLGALRPRRINMQLCTASHRDLRAEIAESRFREDLYFRISQPEAIVLPLRQRPEEIPWLIALALRGVVPSLVAATPLVESCLLREWPGNARELLAASRTAAGEALGQGGQRVELQHLSARAGMAIQKLPVPVSAPGCALQWHPPIQRPKAPSERDRLAEALRTANGNISAAARALGLHRTQLTRLMEKHGVIANRGEQGLSEESEEE